MESATLDSCREIQTQTEGAEASSQVPQSLVHFEWKNPQLATDKAVFPFGLRSAFWVRKGGQPPSTALEALWSSVLDLVSRFPDAPLWLLVRSTSVSQASCGISYWVNTLPSTVLTTALQSKGFFFLNSGLYILFYIFFYLIFILKFKFTNKLQE